MSTDLGLPLRIQKQFVGRILHMYPLPWKIDHDWTVVVLDANGRCVMKLQTDEEAHAFIAFAEALAKEMVENQKVIEDLLKGIDEDPDKPPEA